MKSLIWAILATSLAFSSSAMAGVAGNVSLSHYEPLQQLSVRSMSSSAANGGESSAAGTPLEVRFDALGRSFELRLEANQHLLANTRIDMPLDGVGVYRGEIAGVPGSWARIVMFEGMPRGLIYDGNELLAIEAPGDSMLNLSAPVVYRLADAMIAPGTMSCGAHTEVQSAAASVEQLLGELGDIMQGPGAVSEIEMGAVGDFEFTNARGSDAAAAAAITTRLNNVDGIFSQQVGVQITVTVIETFSSASDPFTDTGSASDLLDELSNYRSTTPAQNSNGLTHLYTGRDLNGSTVGIAWSGALCSNFFGAGLSEGNDGATFDSLIAAHEIGHNFGSPHDGESGSACESETGSFLMSPTLNGSDQFSSCSLTEMSDNIAAASCITALPTVDMTVALTSSANVLFGASTTLNYDVSNNGSVDATNVNVDFTIPANLTLNSATPSAGSCTNGAGTVSCALGDVPGFAVRTVDITVMPASLGAGTLSASVSADVDERPTNNQESLQLMVDPAVNLVVGTPSGGSVKVGQSATITASLQNTATLDATGVTVTVDLGNALQATTASWSLGSCTVSAQQVTCQAATFAAQSNASVSVTASAISAGNPNINVSVTSAEADLVIGDNFANGRLTVNDPKDDSGGGSTSPLFLGLLAAFIAIRRSRRRIL